MSDLGTEVALDAKHKIFMRIMDKYFGDRFPDPQKMADAGIYRAVPVGPPADRRTEEERKREFAMFNMWRSQRNNPVKMSDLGTEVDLDAEHGHPQFKLFMRFMDKYFGERFLEPEKMSDPDPGQFDDAENEDDCTEDAPKTKRRKYTTPNKMSDPDPGQFDDAENEDDCTEDAPKTKRRKYTTPNKKKKTTDKIDSELDRLLGNTDKVLEVFNNRYRKLEKNRNRLKELVEDTQIWIKKNDRETEEMTSLRFGKIMENFNTSQEKVNGMKSAIEEEILKINQLKNTLGMTRDIEDQIIKEKAAEEIRRLECEIQTSKKMTSMPIAEIIEYVNTTHGKADWTKSVIDEEILKINKLKNTLVMIQGEVDPIIKEIAAEEIRRLECEIQTSEKMTSMPIAEIIEYVNTSQGKADGMKSAIDLDIAQIKVLQNDLATTREKLAQIIQEKAIEEKSRLECEILKLRVEYERLKMANTEFEKKIDDMKQRAAERKRQIDDKIKDLNDEEDQKRNENKIEIDKMEKELHDHEENFRNAILGWEEQKTNKKKILNENKKNFQKMKDNFEKDIKYLDQQKDQLKHKMNTMEKSFTSHRWSALKKDIQALQQNNEDNKTKIQTLSVTAAQAKGNMEKSTQIIVSIEKSIEELRNQLEINEEEFGNDDDDEITTRCGRRKCDKLVNSSVKCQEEFEKDIAAMRQNEEEKIKEIEAEKQKMDEVKTQKKKNIEQKIAALRKKCASNAETFTKTSSVPYNRESPKDFSVSGLATIELSDDENDLPSDKASSSASNSQMPKFW